jgi:hypothetical protein
VPSATDPPSPVVESAETDLRRLAVRRWALGISAAWLVPLVVLAAVIGYLGLVFVGFVAEGLGGETTMSSVLTVVGVPALALVLGAAVGLSAAAAAAWGAHVMTPRRRAPAWLLGLAAATLGGVAGAGTFWETLSTASLILSD